MTAPTITNPVYTVISRHHIADVWLSSTNNQHSLHASRAFNSGDIITSFTAACVHRQARYLTIQISTARHIELHPAFLQYTNHSCNPNAFFNTTSMKFVCIQTILPGDELSFFYPGTEWEMAQPFLCNCGSPNCLRLINGAAHLSKETLAKYWITDFIHQQLKQTL
jgi:SET domain